MKTPLTFSSTWKIRTRHSNRGNTALSIQKAAPLLSPGIRTGRGRGVLPAKQATLSMPFREMCSPANRSFSWQNRQSLTPPVAWRKNSWLVWKPHAQWEAMADAPAVPVTPQVVDPPHPISKKQRMSGTCLLLELVISSALAQGKPVAPQAITSWISTSLSKIIRTPIPSSYSVKHSTSGNSTWSAYPMPSSLSYHGIKTQSPQMVSQKPHS